MKPLFNVFKIWKHVEDNQRSVVNNYNCKVEYFGYYFFCWLLLSCPKFFYQIISSPFWIYLLNPSMRKISMYHHYFVICTSDNKKISDIIFVLPILCFKTCIGQLIFHLHHLNTLNSPNKITILPSIVLNENNLFA